MRAEDLFAEIEQSDPEFREQWALEGPKMTLGSNVYHLRTSRGWTQKDLARLAGMSQPRIAELERGDGNPKFETLIRLAGAFDVSLCSLVSTSTSIRTADSDADAGAEWNAVHNFAHFVDDALANFVPSGGNQLLARTRPRQPPYSRIGEAAVLDIEFTAVLERISREGMGNRNLFEDSEDFGPDARWHRGR